MDWTSSGGRLHLNITDEASSKGYAIAYHDLGAGCADAYAEADIWIDLGSPAVTKLPTGIILRFVDTDNFLYGQHTPGNNWIWTAKRVGGSETTLGYVAGTTAFSDGETLKAAVNDDDFRFYHNGTLKVAKDNGTGWPAGTKVGIETQVETGASIDGDEGAYSEADDFSADSQGAF